MADDAWLSQMRRGILEMCILNLLAREAMHGYRLARSLDTVPGLVVTEGTLYPLLSRLQREGLVVATIQESSQGPARKVYVLSARGRAKRDEMNRTWRQIAESVEEITG